MHSTRSITERLDRMPINKSHLQLAFIGGLGLLFDGMDGSLVSYILTVIRDTWDLTGLQSGLIGSSLLIGMFMGALSAGSLSDRVGRRNIMLWAMAVYTLASLAAAASMNWQMFFTLRVIAGIGIGAESAVIPAYISELIPAKRRGLFAGGVAGFLAFGYVFAALIGNFVVARFDQGWRWGQVVTALPVLLLLWFRRKLPESPRWLLEHGLAQKAASVVDNLEAGRLQPVRAERKATTTSGQRKGSYLDPLRGGLLGRTLLLWLLWTALTFSFFGFFTWIPSLLVDRGMSVTSSFTYSLVITIAQIPGYYLASWLNEKLGRKWTIAGFLLIGVIGAWLLSQSVSPAQVMITGCLLSAGMNGTYAGLYAYTPEVYPTAIRSTGMGMASAVGRIGGVLAPIIIGVASEGLGFAGVFVMITVVLAATALLVLIFGVSTQGKSLEALTGPIETVNGKKDSDAVA